MRARDLQPADRAAPCGWLAVGLGLIVTLSACAAGGAGHPLAGRIYQVASGRFVDQATLVADLARADFVLLGERHDNPGHQRLEALLVEALQAKSSRPRALAFEMIPSDRQLDLVEYRQRHPDDPAGLEGALRKAMTADLDAMGRHNGASLGRFAWPRIAAATRAVYKSVLGDAGGRSSA